MILLIDIGNTHTHMGIGRSGRVRQQWEFPTSAWREGSAEARLQRFVRKTALAGAALCSVVPWATPLVQQCLQRHGRVRGLELTCRNLQGLGIDYPKPQTIGPDRLANALAAKHHYGAPVVVVDFGTAVTFDVVNPQGDYVGGIIAPGLSAMTSYLHEKTALLPAIRIREPQRVIGKSTIAAMLSGAVHGYRGLIRELLTELKAELGITGLPVVATGGYAGLIAARLPLITAVDPRLTLEGLRLFWKQHDQEGLLMPRGRKQVD